MTTYHRIAFAVVGAALGAACSTTTVVEPTATTGGGSTTVTTGGGGTGTGTGTLAPGCPASDPGDGAACATEGVVCEYGTDFDPLCNAIRVCSDAKWRTPVHPGGPAGGCPTKMPTLGQNPAGCAASPDAVPVGAACAEALTCHYDGATCFCGVFCESYPVGFPPCDADAGVVDNCCDMQKIAWHCFTGPAYCPSPRPRVGTACSEEGASCAVEPAAECGQATLVCKGGVWDVGDSTCPISTARAKEEIAYLDDAARAKLRDDLARVRLASYRYKHGDGARHLGFVIEDMPPGSPAVMPSRERVDLYGYVSMAVAALQEHERELAALRAEVARLAAENERLRAAAKRPGR